MPATLNTADILQAVIGTEHILLTAGSFLQDRKWFSGYVDLSAMASGDTVELRGYVITKTAGSYMLYQLDTYTDVQTQPIIYFPPMPNDLGIKFTLRQTLGTGRLFPYRIYEI